jgi:hypothetical protein
MTWSQRRSRASIAIASRVGPSCRFSPTGQHRTPGPTSITRDAVIVSTPAHVYRPLCKRTAGRGWPSPRRWQWVAGSGRAGFGSAAAGSSRSQATDFQHRLPICCELSGASIRQLSVCDPNIHPVQGSAADESRPCASRSTWCRVSSYLLLLSDTEIRRTKLISGRLHQSPSQHRNARCPDLIFAGTASLYS